ncbi:extracellular matrix FRAS1 isoform X2 [Brachionus plicatilis]|uniref:Extracellular matrix FRAS1 isoform X2 n=1 Tax=Brachionus plicatilis TaxID=10195 RepID=A0A3M7TAY3_BRAPC|nr:extracellular matrix FRAS1 isoform X2 [Brachionus plicatilis]
MIDRKKLRTVYSWEISTPNEYGDYSQFIKLTQNSFFSQTNESILEPIYFQAKFRIRCVIEYTRDNSRTIKSNFVQVVESSQVLDELELSSRQRCEEKWSHLSKQTINLNSSIPSNFYSKSADSSLPLLNLKFDTPFIAKADYISADFIKNNPDLVDHLNYVRLSIQVPYTDGIVPLVSTMPILNIRHLINDEFHFYPNHICSNFIKLSSQDNHLKFGFEDQLETNSDRNQWIETSQKINSYRNNKTLKFYSNLDRDKCVWKITGFYDLTELTSYCQAQIVSSDLSDNSKSYLSIRIPLYVSYLYQSYQATWSSVDYKTSVEAAIKYKTKEPYDHLVDDEVSNREENRDLNFEMDKSLMSLSVSKISMTENGRLIIEFSTVPSFHGQFIKQRQDGLQSLILPPGDLNTKFNLELVWSQYTYDYPEQTWKATSTDILNNFSGNYTIHLIPCYAKPNQSFKYPYECEPGEPLSYTIPITVEQSSMPVPSKYSLGTRLTLSNNLISSINPSINNQQFDGEFRQGDTVYGSVIWDGDEDQKSVYSLELERVFICSSDPSSVQVYDPDGTVYNKGPMFGCSQPHKSLKHRILLLDKNLPSESPRFEAQFLNDFLNTSNSTRLNTEKLKKNLVIDGFKFSVNFMFKIDNMTKRLDQSPSVWYIQTMFYIRAGNSKRTRHVNIHSLRNVFNNGTNMNIIQLKADKRTSLLKSKIKAGGNREKSGSPGLVKVIIPIILLLIVAILVIGSLVYYKKERLILLFNTESGNNDKNGILNLARKKFGKNLSEKELKESASSSTNETMVVASPLLETTKEKKFEDGNLTFQTVVSKSSNYVTPGQMDEDDQYARKMSGDHKSGSSIKYLLDRVFGSRKEHKILKSLSTTSEYDDLSKNFLDQPTDEVPQFPKYPTIKRNNYLYFNYNNNRMNYFSSENVEVDVEKSELSNKFANGTLTETMVAVSSMSGASPTQTTPVNSTTKCALPTVKRLSGTEV